MVYVSWYGARAYCQWLAAQTGENYCLPSEAQWEYAARGGQQSKGFEYAGSHNLKEVGWYKTNSHSETKPVGLKKANELGLYDMSGNVREWCADEWNDDFQNAPKDGSPAKGDNSEFVVRGGSWIFGANDCSVSVRDRDDSDGRDFDIGFRVSLY
ncbi:MAG: formylglycine-generating enzyme family protein [Saprospiraceae bacterium]|nr:formylglycine-generating enzyme family protein [Saprospiraceae bacterium]